MARGGIVVLTAMKTVHNRLKGDIPRSVVVTMIADAEGQGISGVDSNGQKVTRAMADSHHPILSALAET